MTGKNHPNYPKFKAEWDALVQDYFKDMKVIEEEMRAKNINSGKDGKGSARMKKFSLAIKELQKKYSHLFE